MRAEGWPCERGQLLDDLWAVALSLQVEAKQVWPDFDRETELVGRSFEVWRAPLAVARLFERHGVAGLEATIRRVINAATQEKREDSSDYTTKVVEAIGAVVFAVSDVSDVSDKSDVYTETFTAEQIAKKIVELADLDEDMEWATAKRVGWIFSSLRLPKKPDSSKKKTRFRKITRELVISLLLSYGW